MQLAGQGIAALCHRAHGHIPQAHIGHGAHVQRADLAAQPQRLRRTAAGGMQQRPGGEAVAGHGLHLVAVGQGAQHAQRGAATHVAGHADGHARGRRLLPAEQAAAQEQVGRWAEGDLRAAGLQQGPVGVVQPDAMGQHRTLVQQSVPGIHIQVAARRREQLGDPRHLGPVLGDMGLHVDAGVISQQAAGHGQLRGRAGDGKARRHRIGIAAAAMPALDQRAAVGLGAWHVVAQVVGRVAVHQHLAGDHLHAALAGGGEQRVHTGHVHRGEHHRRGAAVGQQGVGEQRGRHLRHRGVGMAGFGREGVGVEPIQQLGAPAGDHIHLRAMHMGVDEAGQQQAAAVVDLAPVVARGRIGTVRLHRGNAAVVTDQQPVCGAPARMGTVPIRQARVASEVEAVRQDRGLHAFSSNSPRATSRTCSRSQRTAALAWVMSCHSW